MRQIDRQEIESALRAAGLGVGDTVLCYSQLARAGPVAGSADREAFCQSYLDAFRTVLGRSGTLVVPTFTPQVARHDQDFEVETTPCMNGLFSEFVRNHPAAFRSAHPIHSVAALGAAARKICIEISLSDFGWGSSFHALHQNSAKIVAIGLPVEFGVACVHYIEAICCLPHVYNKRLKWRPIKGGVQLKEHRFATVRHLNLRIRYDFTSWIGQLKARGLITTATLGGAAVYSSPMPEIVDVAVQNLKTNPSFFLAEPPNFVYGELPFDGPTANRDGIDTVAGTGHVGPGNPTFNWS